MVLHQCGWITNSFKPCTNQLRDHRNAKEWFLENRNSIGECFKWPSYGLCQWTQLHACPDDGHTWWPQHFHTQTKNKLLILKKLQGFFCQWDIFFNTHTSNSRTLFFHLCNITDIRNILSQSNGEKLVHIISFLRFWGWTIVTHYYQCVLKAQRKNLYWFKIPNRKKKTASVIAVHAPQTASEKLSSSCRMSDSSSQEPKKMTERGGQCQWMGQ